MRLQDIQGRFGLVNVHAEDEVLHRLLSTELDAQGRPAAVLLHPLIEGGIRRGELGLAELVAKQAIDLDLSTLVTTALRDDPEHAAAAFIGRRAAALAGRRLLELQPYRVSAIAASPDSARSTAQPLTVSDVQSTRQVIHLPPQSPAIYHLSSPTEGAMHTPVMVGAPDGLY